ncbi:uncharacterized protein C8Q71DRAFT_903490, partial [Rhodofomes roseus]
MPEDPGDRGMSVDPELHAPPLDFIARWPEVATTWKWNEEDALAAVRRNLFNIHAFLESGRSQFKKHVSDVTSDGADQSGQWWHLASQELANVYRTWIDIAPASAQILYPPGSEVIAQALFQEREESAALRAQLNKRDEWRKPLANAFNQLYERVHADHDLISKGVLATSDELKREVDGLRSTLKAVSGRVDSIAAGPASYAAATASSKGKGRERAPSPPHVHFDEQKTTDPRKRKDRPQTPSDAKAAQAADAAKAKRARSQSPSTATASGDTMSQAIVLDSSQDWARLGQAASIGGLAPSIGLVNALAISKGLEAAGYSRPGAPPPPGPIGSSALVARPGQPATGTPSSKKPVPPAPAKKPPPIHVKQGNPVENSRSVLVRIFPHTFTDIDCSLEILTSYINDACRSSGSMMQAASSVLKNSGRDVIVKFAERPTDELFAVLREKVTALLTALAAEKRPGDLFQANVEHIHELTCVSIKTLVTARAVPGQRKLADVTMEEFWHELVRCAEIDKNTKAFLDVVVPFSNSPRATVERQGSTGQLKCFVRDYHSGAIAHKLASRDVLLFGTRHNVQVYNARNAMKPCTKCWRWGHGSDRCTQQKLCCPLCGEHHTEEAHAAEASCCTEARFWTDDLPVCPSDHHYCPNCLRAGHGPANRTSCTVWKHNNDKALVSRKIEAAESPRQQDDRVKKEVQ